MSDELEVLDLSARPPYPERKHEILAGSDGQTVIYTFKHGERLTMPFEHGCIFMNNPGFHVFEPGASKPYDPTPKPDTPKLTLPEGMVVASLDELTQESLVVRANKAGANMPKSTKKVELIDFLRGTPAEVDLPESDEGDDLVEDVAGVSAFPEHELT